MLNYIQKERNSKMANTAKTNQKKNSPKLNPYTLIMAKELNNAAVAGTISDSENPIFIFNQTSTSLLKQMVSGEIDPMQIILLELKNRGYKVEFTK